MNPEVVFTLQDSDFKDFQPDDYIEFDDHGELCLVFNILIMFCLVHHSIADNRLSESGLDGFFNSRVSSTPIKKKRESPIKNFDGDYALAASIYPNSPSTSKGHPSSASKAYTPSGSKSYTPSGTKAYTPSASKAYTP